MHAQTIRLEGGIGSHGVRFSGVVVGAIAAEWIGFRIERSFAIAFVGIDARRAARGVAADADELAGLPRPAIDLATLKPSTRGSWGRGLFRRWAVEPKEDRLTARTKRIRSVGPDGGC